MRQLLLDQHARESVQQFKLLGSAFIQDCLNTLSKIPFVFISFQGQKDSRRKAEPLGHSHDRIETRNLFPALNVSPKIGGYITAFRSLLETELSSLSEPTNAFGELRAMFQGHTSSHDSEHFDLVTPSIGLFPHELKLYRVLSICRITGRRARSSMFIDRLHDSEAEPPLIWIAQVQNIIQLVSKAVV
jgi:hypothetical protein